jgi:hypothetical protein
VIVAELLEPAARRPARAKQVSLGRVREPIADKGPAKHRPSHLHCGLRWGSAGGIGNTADRDMGGAMDILPLPAERLIGPEPLTVEEMAATSVLPDPGRPLLVARVSWQRRAAAAEYEQRLFNQVLRRRAHRGGFDPMPLSPDLLAVLQEGAGRDRQCCAS